MTKFVKAIGVGALGAALVFGALGAAPARAATQAELEAKIQMLEQSLNQLKTQLTEIKVNQAAQAQQQASYQMAAKDKLPGWLERIEPFGDLRLRYEHSSYDDFNGKSKSDRDRFRFRLRFGFQSQIHEDLKVAFRMASGSDSDPTSTNQTFGDFFAEKTSWGIDQAYVTYTPGFVPRKGLDFTFGKAPNPFVTSKAIWDGDVVPEGAFLKYTFMKGGDIQPFVLGSAMFIDEHSDSSENAYAWSGQVGVNAKFGAFRLTAATAYTDWGKTGDANNVPTNVHGNPIYTENGASRLSKFKVWDLYAKGSYKVNKATKVDAWGHYFKNTDATGPYDGKDSGWAAGAKISYSKFSLGAWYKNVEANATPGFVADSDSGFVNRKGWVLEAGYKWFNYAETLVTYYNTEPIDDEINGASNGSQTLFVDFVFKF